MKGRREEGGGNGRDVNLIVIATAALHIFRKFFRFFLNSIFASFCLIIVKLGFCVCVCVFFLSSTLIIFFVFCFIC